MHDTRQYFSKIFAKTFQSCNYSITSTFYWLHEIHSIKAYAKMKKKYAKNKTNG